ncbi:MAG: sugar phosphate nucleotidyltransferase, partial [Negativicutes bacterium]|nr:sugar phosphate nucleotidyltransferase [Negativicutes bacterium]
ILGTQEVPLSQVSRYGIVEGVSVNEKVYRVEGLVEKPPVDQAPSQMAVLGRYIIEPEIFAILVEQEPGSGGEIQLTDGLNKLAKLKPVYAYCFDGRRYDVGDKEGFLEATVELALKRPDLRDEFLRYLMCKIGPLLQKGIYNRKGKDNL